VAAIDDVIGSYASRGSLSPKVGGTQRLADSF
jgi:hypothetical protein